MLNIDRLREAMQRHGFNQASLARVIGASPAAVQQLLNGTTKRTRFLRDVARALDVSEDWLMGETEVATRQDPFGTGIQRWDDFLFDATGEYSPKPEAWVRRPNLTKDMSWYIRLIARSIRPEEYNQVQRERLSLTTAIVPDDAMAPTLMQDDEVTLLEFGAEGIYRQNAIWALDYAGLTMVRRILVLPDQRLKLIADNPSHQDLEVEKTLLDRVRRVVWTGRFVA